MSFDLLMGLLMYVGVTAVLTFRASWRGHPFKALLIVLSYYTILLASFWMLAKFHFKYDEIIFNDGLWILLVVVWIWLWRLGDKLKKEAK